MMTIEQRATSLRLPVWCRIGVMAVVSWMSAIHPAEAQRVPRPFRESVTLSVDAEAVKILRTVDERVREGRWSDAISPLLELLETRGHGLVAQERSPSQDWARYVSVAAAAEQYLLMLPAEALQTYRQRMDPTAERWWQEWLATRDEASLQRIIQRAFLSRRGEDALWQLGHEAWRRGDLPLARRCWTALLPADDPWAARGRRYPDPRRPAADIAARVLLCGVLTQSPVQTARQQQQFQQRHGDVAGELAGRQGPWGELLTQFIATQSPRDPITEGDVTTFAGSPQRMQSAARLIDVGTELWSVVVRSQTQVDLARATLFPATSPLCYYPAVVDDIVFLNDGEQIAAWNLFSGTPAWGSRESAGVIYPPVEPGDTVQPSRPVTGSPAWSVTISDGRLFARMGSSVTTPAPQEFRELPNQLVCLDVFTGEGRLVWRRQGDDLPLPETDADLPSWRWEGSPVVTEGRVYAAVSRRRPQLEWGVVCLDAESGAIIWQRPVAISRPTLADHENRASQLLLTLGDDLLYLSTESGVITAVSTVDGGVRWALSYESQSRPAFAAQPTERHWPAPPLIHDGSLYVAPADANHVYALDAATGAILWQSPQPEEPLRALLGIANERLFVSGRSLWALSAVTGDIAWSVRQTEPEDFLFGRGTLVGNQIVFCTREALFVADQRTGQLVREQPLLTPDQPRTGGHVVISRDHLLVAGPDRLTVYGSTARRRENLTPRLTATDAPPGERYLAASNANADGQQEAARAAWKLIVETAGASRWGRLAATRLQPSRRVAKPRPVQTAVTRVPGNTEPRVKPVYWKRRWQHSVLGKETALVPEDLPSDLPPEVVLVDGPEGRAVDRRTGQPRWPLPTDSPLVWTANYGGQLLLATETELTGVEIQTGAILWRHLLDTLTSGSAPRTFATTSKTIVISAPNAQLQVLEARTGRLCWERATGPVAPAVLGSWILFPPTRSQSAGLWEASTRHRVQRWDHLTEPWRQAPVLASTGDWLIVTADRRIEVMDGESGERKWEFHGAVSHAHCDPWLFERAGRHFVLIDGVTLAHVVPPSGLPRWSSNIARGPLLDPPRQLAVGEELVLAAGYGELWATRLSDGRLAWRQQLSSANSSQRVVLLDEGGCCAVLPAGPEPQASIPVYRVATGERLQTLHLDQPSSRIQLTETSDGFLLTGPGLCAAYAAVPTDHAVAIVGHDSIVPE